MGKTKELLTQRRQMVGDLHKSGYTKFKGSSKTPLSYNKMFHLSETVGTLPRIGHKHKPMNVESQNLK